MAAKRRRARDLRKRDVRRPAPPPARSTRGPAAPPPRPNVPPPRPNEGILWLKRRLAWETRLGRAG